MPVTQVAMCRKGRATLWWLCTLTSNSSAPNKSALSFAVSLVTCRLLSKSLFIPTITNCTSVNSEYAFTKRAHSSRDSSVASSVV